VCVRGGGGGGGGGGTLDAGDAGTLGRDGKTSLSDKWCVLRSNKFLSISEKRNAEREEDMNFRKEIHLKRPQHQEKG